MRTSALAHRRGVGVGAGAVLGLLCLLSGGALAQPKQDADVCLSELKCAELVEAASTLSQSGKTDAALSLYQAAYNHRPAAWLLVNIGRLQQKLSRWAAAAKSFRQYLASDDAKNDAQLAKTAQEYLREVEQLAKASPPEQPPEQTDFCLSDTACAELNEAARNLSKSGRLGAALTLFETAYALRPAAWLLFNIARLHHKLDHLTLAIEFYRRYLASSYAKEDPDLTRKAQNYLALAESEIEPSPAPLIPPPPPPPPIPPPPPLPGDAPADGYGSREVRQKHSGFAVEIGFGSRHPVVQVDAASPIQSTSLSWTGFLGYKTGRFIVGAGFALDYFTGSSLVIDAGATTISASTTSYLFTPGLQAALLRVAAGRVELLASGQLGLGQAITNRTQDPALSIPTLLDSSSSHFHLNYQLGPGLRVFVMPRLALGAVVGLAGDHFFPLRSSTPGLNPGTLSSLSIFGRLGVLAIF